MRQIAASHDCLRLDSRFRKFGLFIAFFMDNSYKEGYVGAAYPSGVSCRYAEEVGNLFLS